MNLKAKVTLIIIPLIVLPLLSLGLIAYYRLQDTSQQTIFDQINTLVNQVAINTKLTIQTATSNAHLFSVSRLVRNYMLADELDRYEVLNIPLLKLFKTYSDAYPDYYEIRILLKDGYEDARFSTEHSPNITEEEGETPYFLSLSQSESEIYTTVFKNPDNNEYAFLASHKLFIADVKQDLAEDREPKLRGYLLITIRLNFLKRQVLENRIGKTGFIFFANDQGEILFHPNENEVGKPVSDDLLQQISLDGNNTSVLETEYQQEPAFIQSRKLHKNLYLFVVLPEQELLAESQKLGMLVAAIMVLTIFLTVTLFFLLINFLIIKPIYALEHGAKEIGHGNLDVELSINTQDEIGTLASQFNEMAQGLKVAKARAESLTLTFQKFVPQQFLQRIAQEGIENIQLGEAQSEQLTILFADLRSFTTLSEALSPQQILDFVNDYFERMNHPIHGHNGFIDKFIGDAIMALFANPTIPKQARDSILAALAMQEAVRAYNKQRASEGSAPIAIGIGIHSGPAVIGTVGSKDRMDSTVLGDSVNVASRLEGLTKPYGAKIIISGETYQLVRELGDYLVRELDWVRVKGKSEPIHIFELYEGDSPEIRTLKRSSADHIYAGLVARQKKNWDEAIACFQQALEIHPGDLAARVHISQCEKLRHMALPTNWDGAIMLDYK